MSVYKDEQRGTWYCMFRYNDWTGRQKQKCKRGFKTKREAKEYEEQFMQTTEADMNMKVGAFVEIYFRDNAGCVVDHSVWEKLMPFLKGYTTYTVAAPSPVMR